MTPTTAAPTKPVPEEVRMCVLCGTYRPIAVGWAFRRIYGLKTLVCVRHAIPG